MTVFLTTQYLEEADELADRVGIIRKGLIVAEGTPEELKRSVGTDVIVVRVDSDVDAARAALDALDEVDHTDRHGDELVASVDDGPRSISPVALALAAADVRVRDLSLRRPTLDDVFFSVTGERIADADGDRSPADRTGSTTSTSSSKDDQ
jgi:ABC-2 type transport system ATP-binding protein